jgi:hypothetical protein
MGITNLGCHELRCTTEGASGAAVPHVLLAKTVISNLDVTIKSQQNVVELQITVDDAILVEVLESQANFRSIEPSSKGLISRVTTENQP